MDQDHIGAAAHLFGVYRNPAHIHHLAGRRKGNCRVTFTFEGKILHRCSDYDDQGNQHKHESFHMRYPLRSVRSWPIRSMSYGVVR